MNVKIALILSLVFNVVFSLQVSGATLEFYGGGFAATPYLSAVSLNKETDEHVVKTYDPGTIYSQAPFPGDKTINAEFSGYGAMAKVSWSADVASGKTATLDLTSHIEATAGRDLIGYDNWSFSSLRLQTQYNSQPSDGIFFQIVAEAGEGPGFQGKVDWALRFNGSGRLNRVFGYGHLSIDSGNGNSAQFTRNGNVVLSLPVINPSSIEFHDWYGSDPGFDNYFPQIDAKIGDIIGINSGYFYEVSGRGVNWGEFESNFFLTAGSFTESTVPLPGAVLLLGAGLGRLALYRRRKMTGKN